MQFKFIQIQSSFLPKTNEIMNNAKMQMSVQKKIHGIHIHMFICQNKTGHAMHQRHAAAARYAIIIIMPYALFTRAAKCVLPLSCLPACLSSLPRSRHCCRHRLHLLKSRRSNRQCQCQCQKSKLKRKLILSFFSHVHKAATR